MTDSIIHHSVKGEIKNSLAVSIPLIASQMILAMSGFIGTIIVAHLNKEALAASVLVSMLWWTLSVLFFGILNATSVLVSQQYGAKNHGAISEVMGQSLLLALIMCIPMMLILMAAPYFLRFSAQPPVVLDYARAYFHSLVWCTPGILLLITLEQFLTGIGRTKLVLAISILEVPIEIALIYALTFGKFGLPNCGIAGVGYGFTVAFSVTAIVLALYLLHAEFAKPLHIYKRLGTFNKKYFLELLHIGWPIGGMYLIEVGAFAVATFMMAHFSSTTLAAHQIAFQFLGFTINIVFGMAQAVTIRIGQAAGREDLVGVKYAAYVGMFLSFGVMLFISIVYLAFPRWLIGLDVNTSLASNLALVHQATVLLGIIGIFQLFDNFRLIEVGALRGLKDTKLPMLISFISFWLVGIVASFCFAFILHGEGAGIWWGLTLGIASGAIILFFRLQYLLKKVNLKEMVQIG